jgi:hypothetical protein
MNEFQKHLLLPTLTADEIADPFLFDGRFEAAEAALSPDLDDWCDAADFMPHWGPAPETDE